MNSLSKYRKDEPASISKHRHCENCGTPVDMSKHFCGDKCRLERGRAAKSKNRNLIIIMGIVLVVYFLLIFGGRI
jgi:predicted nucleic acid-binding Zn ribbon protein